MYGNCNSRTYCSSKSSLNEDSIGQNAYRMAIEAVLSPDAICLGTGPGNGVNCSYYGAARRAIGGPHGIGDPVLAHRSWLSSGCPPTRLEQFEDESVEFLLAIRKKAMSQN